MSRALFLIAGLAAVFLVASAIENECQVCKDFVADLKKDVSALPTIHQLETALDLACHKYAKPHDVKRCISTETPQLPFVKKAFEQNRAIIDICKDLKHC